MATSEKYRGTQRLRHARVRHAAARGVTEGTRGYQRVTEGTRKRKCEKRKEGR